MSSVTDMQKFPLRMKDNDLLVTELYRDPNNDPVTAISVYLTPKTSKCYVIIFSQFKHINLFTHTHLNEIALFLLNHITAENASFIVYTFNR